MAVSVQAAKGEPNHVDVVVGVEGGSPGFVLQAGAEGLGKLLHAGRTVLNHRQVAAAGSGVAIKVAICVADHDDAARAVHSSTQALIVAGCAQLPNPLPHPIPIVLDADNVEVPGAGIASNATQRASNDKAVVLSVQHNMSPKVLHRRPILDRPQFCPKSSHAAPQPRQLLSEGSIFCSQCHLPLNRVIAIQEHRAIARRGDEHRAVHVGADAAHIRSSLCHHRGHKQNQGKQRVRHP